MRELEKIKIAIKKLIERNKFLEIEYNQRKVDLNFANSQRVNQLENELEALKTLLRREKEKLEKISQKTSKLQKVISENIKW